MYLKIILICISINLFQGVQEEVRKVNKVDGHRSNLTEKNSLNDLKQSLGVDTTSSGVVIVSGVAKKKDNNTRGELIEQNQDALEVCHKSIINKYILHMFRKFLVFI